MALLLGNSRIKVFLGEYGSGKTELAVNYAIAAKKQNANIAIVDFDLVKPYFRTRENRELLEAHNILVVSPEPKFSNADLPILPHDFIRTIYDERYQVIIDVGGGEAAVVLGQINQHLNAISYDAFFVINTFRPFSNSEQEIITNLRLIERAARLKVSGLISNTNLAASTTTENIIEGLQLVQEVGKQTKLPVSCVVVPEWLKENFNTEVPVFTLKPVTQYPWMDN